VQQQFKCNNVANVHPFSEVTIGCRKKMAED